MRVLNPPPEDAVRPSPPPAFQPGAKGVVEVCYRGDEPERPFLVKACSQVVRLLFPTLFALCIILFARKVLDFPDLLTGLWAGVTWSWMWKDLA